MAIRRRTSCVHSSGASQSLGLGVYADGQQVAASISARRYPSWRSVAWRGVLMCTLLQAAVWVMPMEIAHGQAIKLVTEGNNGEGCIDKIPDPPRNVQAVPKDGKLIITWDTPSDGSCVDTYVVNVVDPSFRSDQPVQSSSTDLTNTTIEGLENGKQYKLSVQSYSQRFRNGGTADVTAAPSNRCIDRPPGKPINLRVMPGDGMAQLCWDGVDNDACVDEYRVSAVRTDSAFRALGDQAISRGACINITQLSNDVEYKFTVAPTSAKYGDGKAASVKAYVGAKSVARNGWRCKKMNGCRPNSISACSLTGCQTLDKLGGCKGPFMYDLQYMARQVTQWCSEVCGCDISVAQAFNPLTWSGYQTLGTLASLPFSSLTPGSAPSTPSSSISTSPAGSGILSNFLSSGLVPRPSDSSSTPGEGRWGLAAERLGSSGFGSGAAGAAGALANAAQRVGTLGTSGAMVLGGLTANMIEGAVESGQVGQVAGQVVSSVTNAVVSGAVNQMAQTALDMFNKGLEAATGNSN